MGLREAAVTSSDNTAANLLLSRVGGPSGLSEFFRSCGDETTRLDRNEPMLNENLPGDERDTTTPRAMVSLMETILLGNVLGEVSKQRLVVWLSGSKTGAERLRAGFPPGYRVGNKTGTGNRGAVGDVALARLPGTKPILIACYMSGSTAPLDRLAPTHAEIARNVVVEFRGRS
jgi:beta-lactamase class A